MLQLVSCAVHAAVGELRCYVQLVTAERSKKDSEQRLQELRPELERCKAAREVHNKSHTDYTMKHTHSTSQIPADSSH